MIGKSSQTFECEYCGKAFRKETTLLSHSCEPKRRAEQEKEVGVQFGYRAYKRFYEISQPSGTKKRSYAEFSKSRYYTAFVKFGRHIKMTNSLKPEAFIDWVIRQKKPVDRWCRDDIYEEYLMHILRSENPDDALDRAIRLMVDWSEQAGGNWQHWFRYAGDGKVCIAIANGRLSPWILYNTKEGQDWLAGINEEQLGMIYHIIDPGFWQSRFENYSDDVSWLKTALKEAGL